ncbi:hypothetical protein DUI87_24757 [Hirundo rustica rustica]|uniref:G-protein coupled receptors family 1 profile domain-containing protein n=1 Tax=Hirundo rustica rustica TaxID=333673 RepID=A0A3M0JHR3_HIRRU|nr:hypothetical protein DUI87_24757 [Hirundo rustica rustica]
MAHKSVLALVALLLFGIPQPIENGLDEDVQMSTEDLEQATPEPPEPSWTPVVMAALQQGPYWAAADLLFVPLYLWFRRRRAAKRQRAAAQQAEVEARRRRREIEQRRLRLKRTVRDLKEMWRTMNTIRRKMARLVGTSRKMSRRAKTMAHKSVLALVALLLFGIPQPIENGLDEDVQMSTEDLEQATPEPPEPSWRPVLMAALQQGPYWAAADLLFVPLYLWFRRTRAAKRQRAAARQAEAEARRRRREIEQRRLRLKRTVRDLKEMWRTMNMIRKKTARLVGTSRKMSRRVKTMAHKSVLALVALLLFGIPQPIENGLDEDAQMSTEDLEQATPEPPEPSWTPVLMAALQQGPYWAAADLLFCLCTSGSGAGEQPRGREQRPSKPKQRPEGAGGKSSREGFGLRGRSET